MKIFTRTSINFTRMALLVCAVFLVASAVLVWDAGESSAETPVPAWVAYAQHEATASYWLDDDLGPQDFAPQDDVDEQEHVY